MAVIIKNPAETTITKIENLSGGFSKVILTNVFVPNSSNSLKLHGTGLTETNYNVNYIRELYRPRRVGPVKPFIPNTESGSAEQTDSVTLNATFITNTNYDKSQATQAFNVQQKLLNILDYLFGRAFRTAACYKVFKRKSDAGGNRALLIYKLDVYGSNNRACMVECYNQTIEENTEYYSCNYRLRFRNYPQSATDIKSLFLTDKDEIREDAAFVIFDSLEFPDKENYVNLCDYGESQLPVYSGEAVTVGKYIIMLQHKKVSLADTYFNADKIQTAFSAGDDISLETCRKEIEKLNSSAADRTKMYDGGFTRDIKDIIEKYETIMDRVSRLKYHSRTSADDFRNFIIYNGMSYTVGASDSLILNVSTFCVDINNTENIKYVTDESLPGISYSDGKGLLTLGTGEIAVSSLTNSEKTVTLLKERVAVTKCRVNVNDSFIIKQIHREKELIRILRPYDSCEDLFNAAYKKVMSKLFDTDTYEISYNQSGGNSAVRLYTGIEENMQSEEIIADSSSTTYTRIKHKYFQEYVLFPSVENYFSNLRRSPLTLRDRVTLKENDQADWEETTCSIINNLVEIEELPDMFADNSEYGKLDNLFCSYLTYYKNPDMVRADEENFKTLDNPTIQLGSFSDSDNPSVYLLYDSVYDDVYGDDGTLESLKYTPDGGYSTYENYIEVYNQQFETGNYLS